MYFIIGRMSGSCEHDGHETWEKAQECLVRFQSECRKCNKTSDRVIVEGDSLEQIEDELTFY